MISEAASKKPKRGRPKLVPDEARYLVKMMAGQARSERSLQNYYFSARAMNVLRGAELLGPGSWLMDEEELEALGDKGKVRWTMFAELGRIQDEATLVALGSRLNELRPRTTKDAICIVRRFRRGTESEGSVSDLVLELARRVDDYHARHPGMTQQQLIFAGRKLLEALELDEETD
jgi:hypothetical protein